MMPTKFVELLWTKYILIYLIIEYFIFKYNMLYILVKGVLLRIVEENAKAIHKKENYL